MLAAVNGYYDGEQIVMDEKVKMQKGQKVIITILEYSPMREKKIDLKKYMGRGEKLFQTDAGEYVKGLRSDDRV